MVWRLIQTAGEDGELVRIAYPNRPIEYIKDSFIVPQYHVHVVCDVYTWDRDDADGWVAATEAALLAAVELCLRECAAESFADRPERNWWSTNEA